MAQTSTQLSLLKCFTFLLAFAVISGETNAQLTVSNATVQYLVENIFLGKGVTVSNITYTGSANAVGYFQFFGPHNGIERGILLTTGNISNAPGPNNNSGAGSGSGSAGIPDLNPLTTGSTTDGAMIEFDFVASETEVNFRYIFASEEYPEFSGSPFNDVFAFFISGPGITGTKNIALIPNSTTPIAINNVNNGAANSGPCTNCEYYVQNTSNIIQYDGHTTVLTAASSVIPCQTYHLKIAIADVGDPAFDSGVFLSAESLCSNKTLFQTLRKLPPTYLNSVYVDSMAYEGCSPVKVYIQRACQIDKMAKVHITYSGTATPGVDYEAFPDSITFLPGQEIVELNLKTYKDLLNENTETVILNVFNNECGQTVLHQKTFIINDNVIKLNLGNDTTMCSGQSLTLNAAGIPAPQSYVWQDLSYQPTLKVTGPGTYWCRIQKGSCILRDSIVVTYIPSPTVNIGPDTITCAGNPVTFTVPNTAGINYLWSNGSSAGNLTTTQAGTFWVKAISASSGCFTYDTAKIIRVQKPPLNLGNDTSFCARPGDSVLLSTGLNTPYQFTWNNTNQHTPSIKVGNSGTYIVRVNDPYCITQDTIVVEMKPKPDVALGKDTFFCSGSTIKLSAGAGFDAYLWSTFSTDSFITVNQSSIYTATVWKGTCADKDTVLVFERPMPTNSIGNDTSVCPNDSVLFNGKGATGYTYLWDNGAVTPTTYYKQVGAIWLRTTFNGCTKYDTAMMRGVHFSPVNLGNDTTYCANSGKLLDAGNQFDSYLWSTGETAPYIVANATGTYWVRAQKEHCFTSDTILINLKTTPQVNLGADSSLCEGAEKELDATCPNCSYVWNTGETTSKIRVSTPGQFVVTAKNNVGCEDSDTIQIGIEKTPVFALHKDTTVCKGESVTLLSPVKQVTYLWNTGATDSAISITDEGEYWLRVSKNGCYFSDTMHLSHFGDLVVHLPEPQLSCYNTKFTLDAGNERATYLWSTGDTTGQIQVKSAGIYKVSVTRCGVTREASSTINYQDKEFKFYVPNAFTPDNNLLNDEFKPGGNLAAIETYQMQVYDRWGKKLFETDDPNKGWDGKTGGIPCANDVFVWQINLKATCYGTKQIQGNVTIMR